MGGHADSLLHPAGLRLQQRPLQGHLVHREHLQGHIGHHRQSYTFSLSQAFMAHAKDMDLRDLLDEAAWILKEYESESGTKQSFGYEVKRREILY